MRSVVRSIRYGHFLGGRDAIPAIHNGHFLGGRDAILAIHRFTYGWCVGSFASITSNPDCVSRSCLP
jgi:hypothetical protein